MDFCPSFLCSYALCVPVYVNSKLFRPRSDSNLICLSFHCFPALHNVLDDTYRRRFRGQSAKGKPKGRATGKDEPENRTSLTNIRVVQRNLVYVTNLSLDVAKEEVRTFTHTPFPFIEGQKRGFTFSSTLIFTFRPSSGYLTLF